MRILVTGGSGTLGRAFLPAARTAGHQLRVLSRREQPAQGAAGEDAATEWVTGDLTTGAGLDRAVTGVDAIVHAASDPQRAKAVDVEGTRQLLEAARRAGLRHFVYVSIVGVDAIPYAFYQLKYQAEQLVRSSGVPYSIVRATQFHSFVAAMIAGLARVPGVMPVPSGFSFQSVSEHEVAARLLRALDDGPSERLIDFAGPEVLGLDAMARSWMAAHGVRKPLVPFPVPGRIGAAFRAGRNTAPHGERGVLRWEDWLR